MECEISPFEQSLGPVLLSLRSWGKYYGGSIEGVPQLHQRLKIASQTHAPCNVKLSDARGLCAADAWAVEMFHRTAPNELASYGELPMFTWRFMPQWHSNDAIIASR